MNHRSHSHSSRDRLLWRLLWLVIGSLVVILIVPTVHAVGLEKLVMPGRVIEGHADIEGECGACHDTDSAQATAALCVSCHEDIGKDRDSFTGFHGLFDTARENQCTTCHTDHEGRNADIVALESGVFDHAFTDFPLQGAHGSASCGDCHQPQEKYSSAADSCGSCHAAEDVHEGALGPQCQTCHNDSMWQETSFQHSLTDYPLTGAHIATECVDCHRGNQYSGVPQTCNSCHAIDDVHRGNNGTDCQSCHSTETWVSIGFNHLEETGFSLAAGHGGLACQDCHSRDDFRDDFSAGCAGCHQGEDDHQGRNGTQCGDCHSTETWPETRFLHADTGFELHDAHAQVNCVGCHKAEVEQKPPADCQGCHAMDDPHGGQMNEDCSFCHVQTAWLDSIAFDHDLSGFPLTGLHAPVSCGGCHESKQFTSAPTNCYGCHADDDTHRGTLGTDCADCHTSNGWSTTVFDHDVHTDFALDGGHDGLSCTACHQDPEKPAAAVPGNCGGCHANDDPHDGQFGVQCGDCHNTTDFIEVERL